MTPLQQYQEETLKKFEEEFINYFNNSDESTNFDGMNEAKSFLLASLKGQLEVVETEIDKLTTRDHSKCPILQTCIGYQNCVSDIDNFFDSLTPSLVRNKISPST
jgi:predicted HAD superfamily hydrolase